MAATRVGARLARRLASATGPPCAVEPPPKSTNVFLLYGAPKRSFSSTAGATGEAPAATGVTGVAAGGTGAAAGPTGAAEGATGAAAGATGAAAGATGAAAGATGAAAGATGAPKRSCSSTAGLKPPPVYGDAYVLYGAPTAAPYAKRCFSTTSAGASGGKPAATGVTDATAGATGVAAPGATGADPSSASVTRLFDRPTDVHPTGAAGAAEGATGAAEGATGAAAGATDASGVILKPLVKITTEDVINEWKNSAGFRKALYIGASALIGGSAATISLAYVSMESRLSNKLTVAAGELKECLAAAQREDIERREVAERKDKQRREDWARNIQLLVNDILSKIIKLEEKEWKNRHTVMQAEEVLNRFGFSSDAESHYEVAKQFQMLQFQVDYLKSELSKQKETPVADELLQTIADIDSQLTALKKRILEVNIAGGADLIQTGKGVASNHKVKK